MAVVYKKKQNYFVGKGELWLIMYCIVFCNGFIALFCAMVSLHCFCNGFIVSCQIWSDSLKDNLAVGARSAISYLLKHGDSSTLEE